MIDLTNPAALTLGASLLTSLAKPAIERTLLPASSRGHDTAFRVLPVLVGAVLGVLTALVSAAGGSRATGLGTGLVVLAPTGTGVVTQAATSPGWSMTTALLTLGAAALLGAVCGVLALGVYYVHTRLRTTPTAPTAPTTTAPTPTQTEAPRHG